MELLKWRKPMTDEVVVPPIVFVKKKDVIRSEAVRAEVERGWAELAAAREERDLLKQEVEYLKKENGRAHALVDDATVFIKKIEARCTQYQLERDESVARYANLQGKLQSFFTSISAQMQEIVSVQPAPKQTVAADAEAPSMVEATTIRPPTPEDFLARISSDK